TRPPGPAPGPPPARGGEAACAVPGAAGTAAAGRRPTAGDGRLAAWMPWVGGPGARALALAQVAAGLPLTAWGLRRRGGGWAAAGALLVAHGAVGLAYGLTRRP
ncbi:hypothetical protein ACFXAQ_27300, partial [Streptomyces olivaceus]